MKFHPPKNLSRHLSTLSLTPASPSIAHHAQSILPTHLCHQAQPQTQTRHASSTRRHRKLHNIPPAPTPLPQTTHPTASGHNHHHLLPPTHPQHPYTPAGSSGRSHLPRHLQTPQDPGDHIVFNPPPSAPNPIHTPPLFLPREDSRRRLLSSLQGQAPGLEAAGQGGARNDDGGLPRALWGKERVEKRYHVTPAQMEEMRRLRGEDEDKWTRGRLAERFGCSSIFVGMVCQASERRLEKVRRGEERVRRRWGVRRTNARWERRRRREGWERDE